MSTNAHDDRLGQGTRDRLDQGSRDRSPTPEVWAMLNFPWEDCLVIPHSWRGHLCYPSGRYYWQAALILAEICQVHARGQKTQFTYAALSQLLGGFPTPRRQKQAVRRVLNYLQKQQLITLHALSNEQVRMTLQVEALATITDHFYELGGLAQFAPSREDILRC